MAMKFSVKMLMTMRTMILGKAMTIDFDNYANNDNELTTLLTMEMNIMISKDHDDYKNDNDRK